MRNYFENFCCIWFWSLSVAADSEEFDCKRAHELASTTKQISDSLIVIM
jgi:hypothetical protein